MECKGCIDPDVDEANELAVEEGNDRRSGVGVDRVESMSEGWPVIILSGSSTKRLFFRD